jgi:hypothetical protein
LVTKNPYISQKYVLQIIDPPPKKKYLVSDIHHFKVIPHGLATLTKCHHA